MGTFDRAIATAKRQIAKYGQTVSLVTFADGAPPDATKPWRQGTATETTQSVKAVFLSTKRTNEGKAADHRTDADGVPTEERKILIAASGLTSPPHPKGEIRVSSTDRWRIVSVEPLSPNGQSVLYTLTVNR